MAKHDINNATDERNAYWHHVCHAGEARGEVKMGDMLHFHLKRFSESFLYILV